MFTSTFPLIGLTLAWNTMNVPMKMSTTAQFCWFQRIGGAVPIMAEKNAEFDLRFLH